MQSTWIDLQNIPHEISLHLFTCLFLPNSLIKGKLTLEMKCEKKLTFVFLTWMWHMACSNICGFNNMSSSTNVRKMMGTSNVFIYTLFFKFSPPFSLEWCQNPFLICFITILGTYIYIYIYIYNVILQIVLYINW